MLESCLTTVTDQDHDQDHLHITALHMSVVALGACKRLIVSLPATMLVQLLTSEILLNIVTQEQSNFIMTMFDLFSKKTKVYSDPHTESLCTQKQRSGVVWDLYRYV